MFEYIITFTNGSQITIVAASRDEAHDMIPLVEGQMRDNKHGEWIVDSIQSLRKDTKYAIA